MLGGLDYHSIAVAVKRALSAGFGYTAKGDLIVGTGAGSATVKSTTADGRVLVSNSAQSDGLIWTDFARPALNVNPNWLLDQINEGALYTVTGGGANVQGPDGWTGRAAAAPGVFKLRTIADPDYASLKCLEITCTTIDAAIGAADEYSIWTAIEGYDAADLRPGLASASQITVQFDMKFSVAGVYGVAVRNSANNRTYVGTATQNVASARESKSVTLTLDTAGTWLYTSGIGLQISFCLAAGANFQTVAGAWGAGNFLTTAAQANFMSNIANIGYLGRFHVIPSGVALAYASQDMQRELAKAQRYYDKSFAAGTAPAQNVGTFDGAAMFTFSFVGAGTRLGSVRYGVRKRASPTITTYNPQVANANARDYQGAVDVASLTVEGSAYESAFMAYGDTTASALGRPAAFHWTANARLS